MDDFEQQYIKLIEELISKGSERKGRNGLTRALFGKQIKVNSHVLPILQSRIMNYKGVLGELAAIVRGPKHIRDFEKFGCNYWKEWAHEDGSINIDYGNKWFDFNGVDQLANVVESLRNDPFSRRHIISGWDPSSVQTTDLPCCHILYQWFVEGKKLHMVWYQRSADAMLGLPSDAMFAVVLNNLIAGEVDLLPGNVTMFLGDTHIYNEHMQEAKKQVAFYKQDSFESLHTVVALSSRLKIKEFVPDDLNILRIERINEYNDPPKLKFKLIK